MNLLEELLECYTPPRAGMLKALAKICDAIPEEYRQKAKDAMLQEESHSLNIKSLTTACAKNGIPFAKAFRAHWTEWDCDACGHSFKYIPSPDDEDKLNLDVHDRCPNCGFQVTWTKTYRAYLEKGRVCEWYQRLLDEHRAPTAWGRDKPRGVWFSRAKFSREVALVKQQQMDAMAKIDSLLKGASA